MRDIMIIEKICVATDGSDVAVHAAQMAVLLADPNRLATGSVARYVLAWSSPGLAPKPACSP